MEHEGKSIYELVGGEDTFRHLVDIFYAKIEADAYLRPMFPESLDEGKEWQFLFLCQFFGGPQRYAEERGHPRLRMRHAPFLIDQKARDLWLNHMLNAIDEVNIQSPMREMMRNYFERASTHMINYYAPDELNHHA
ncbi:MAG: globin [Phototrophicales bacterium]|nr:MAG: globin [Phototrophicales bacterium]